jgi:hypothetical protein
MSKYERRLAADEYARTGILKDENEFGTAYNRKIVMPESPKKSKKEESTNAK